MVTQFKPIPFILRPPEELKKPSYTRRVRYHNGKPYFYYYPGNAMPTLHTDSIYYDKLTEELHVYFSQAYDENYDLLPHETAVWFDGEENALPDSPLGAIQKKFIEAGGPAKGYRNLHMWKRVIKDNLIWERVAMIPVPEAMCYTR